MCHVNIIPEIYSTLIFFIDNSKGIIGGGRENVHNTSIMYVSIHVRTYYYSDKKSWRWMTKKKLTTQQSTIKYPSSRLAAL